MTRDVLIVEDDAAIAMGLALNLKIEGYATTVAGDGAAALEHIRAAHPALILLDISLPKRNGLDVLAELRKAGDHTPVIVLSARQDEYDKVAALRLGADDYVTKPFALAELLARVAAVLRRAGGPAVAAAPEAGDGKLRFGAGAASVLIDPGTRTVTRDGADVTLTHLEFELLCYFVKNPARVFTREQLLREVWGAQAGSPRTVDNFVAQLRGKLEVDPDDPRHIVTVRGSGYRFDP